VRLRSDHSTPIKQKVRKLIRIASECEWRGFLSLRDPAGAAHAAGPPDQLPTRFDGFTRVIYRFDGDTVERPAPRNYL